ncbi:dihydrodipicolinate synthase family protein [Burkholderia multivorans]|uniref:dihydrodipicolinate synthase family protein n=1 Tax=Burkholderia multivorans TaxID=87883 RepID=UPI00209F4F18|nr:dihydrodipicolinate synthase family protein [Burkholderia multivorans]MCO8588548.1 dihydrodipicolinate synthase family protein [Burkholderia multivorans]MCO8609376.1 dihydrodipicolinate synthase family protein [Burkholderia multivorans]MCO8630734.1 dihydrodipicolinate synthase family protein [Burkholderia multivorans]MCO8635984.1 dihydrodipicolinate synthase family protein [Burkholderia multivorans]
MQLKGILPALVTPFDASGAVDHDTLASILEFQLAAGVSGFVPLGSTGEYYALTNDERRAVMKTVREVVGQRGELVVGANGSCTREVIEQVRQARDAGYTNILIAPPYYALPSQQELIGHYDAILAAVTDVNVILYNYPVRTNVEVGFGVLDAFKDHPRVIGIKESSGNLLRAIEIGGKYKDHYQLSCGSDDQALDFFLWGATSWICGPANCFAKQVVRFYDTFSAGDIAGAQNVMRALFPVMASMESGKFIQKVKYGCELAGFKVGNARMPLQPLTDQEKAEFRAIFEASQA